MTTIVAKFGGTSMGTAKSIKQVAKIITQKKSKVIAVVSATSGTTDLLIKLGESALRGKKWVTYLKEITNKHNQIVEELGIKPDLSSFWDEIEKLAYGINLMREITPSMDDRLRGFGERVSSVILTAYLKKIGHRAQACDAYDLIFTDNEFGEANVNFVKSNKVISKSISKLLSAKITPVVTGFIGRSESGKYSTLGRGGSDYTGAIVAGAISADVLEIWTDVDGILNADPRLIKEAKVIKSLSFEEARELAYFGAKVLHPKTIMPAMKKNIPVKILNTFNTKAKGTIISNQEGHSIKSVTYRKGLTIVNIYSHKLLEGYGFLAKIFEIFSRYGVVIDAVSTSEASASLAVTQFPLRAQRELERFSEVRVKKKMAIVCLVGNGLRDDGKALAKVFKSAEEYDVCMVSQGASNRNIVFLVKEEYAQEVVKKVFHTFF